MLNEPIRQSCLKTGNNDNVQATVFLRDVDQYTVTLVKRRYGRYTGRYGRLNEVKQDLLELKKFIPNFRFEQILKQNSNSDECIRFRLYSIRKIDSLHVMYSFNKEHYVEEHWFRYQIVLVHKPRIMCTYIMCPDINILSRQMHDESFAHFAISKKDESSSTQIIQYHVPIRLCRLLEVMFSVAVSTGWNKFSPNEETMETMQELFFQSDLKFPLKSCFKYKEVIRNAEETSPTF